jgi:hypothetical protein
MNRQTVDRIKLERKRTEGMGRRKSGRKENTMYAYVLCKYSDSSEVTKLFSLLLVVN